MAKDTHREISDLADDLQDLVVRNLSPRKARVLPTKGSGRVLSFGAISTHNNHLQSGRSSGPACPICSRGLEGAQKDTEPRRVTDSEAPLAPSDGDNREEHTPSPPRDGVTPWYGD